MSAILPLGAAFLPYLALVGVIYGGGQIASWVVRTSRDLLQDGPSMIPS